MGVHPTYARLASGTTLHTGLHYWWYIPGTYCVLDAWYMRKRDKQAMIILRSSSCGEGLHGGLFVCDDDEICVRPSVFIVSYRFCHIFRYRESTGRALNPLACLLTLDFAEDQSPIIVPHAHVYSSADRTR